MFFNLLSDMDCNHKERRFDMRKKYIVELTSDERRMLQELISSGKSPARKLIHARILLKADSGDHGPAWLDAKIAEAIDVGLSTVERVRIRFVEEGLEAALIRKAPRRVYLRKLDGDAEAHLVALACNEPPEGRARWTLRLLAEKMVALEYVDSLSKDTVRRTLKKTNLNLG